MDTKKKKVRRGCVECGGDQIYDTRPQVYRYKGHERTVKMSGWYCVDCGEGVFSGDELLPSDRALMEMRAEADQIPLPEEVAAIRKRLGISQREASEVIGGGPNAFNRYESGKTPVSPQLANLLTLLANDPKRLEELRRPARAYGGPKAAARKSKRQG
jgi:HTH-type transcriptional regulator/antitoxin MqsA